MTTTYNITPRPDLRLDPVTAYVDNIEPGKGILTVRCFDRAWTAYWGAMGGKTVEAFVLSCDAEYVACNLTRGNRIAVTRESTQRTEDDYVFRIALALQEHLRQATEPKPTPDYAGLLLELYRASRAMHEAVRASGGVEEPIAEAARVEIARRAVVEAGIV